MDADFYSVAIPEPTTILGVRLRPLSLGHLVILHRLRSSFVTPDEPFTIHDLALSVLVCSLTYEEGVRLFSERHPDRIFKLWWWKLSRPGLLRKLHLRKPVMVDIPAKTMEFADYLKRHSTSPHYEYDADAAVHTSCPTVQLVRVTVMQGLGISDREMMDRSWALCLWDYVTLKSIAGQLRMTDRQSVTDALELANRLAAKMEETK